MGWYTRGPGGSTYKYGDVASAFCDLEVGTFWCVPRLLTSWDSYLLIDLQKSEVMSDIDWSAIPFDAPGSYLPSGIESNKRWIDEVLDEVSEFVRANAGALQKGLQKMHGTSEAVELFTVSLSLCWLVPKGDEAQLETWASKQSSGCTLRRLSEGAIVDSYYHPTKELEPLFEELESYDTGHFLMHMLGAYAVSGQDFFVEQPDDEWQQNLGD